MDSIAVISNARRITDIEPVGLVGMSCHLSDRRVVAAGLVAQRPDDSSEHANTGSNLQA